VSRCPGEKALRQPSRNSFSHILPIVNVPSIRSCGLHLAAAISYPRSRFVVKVRLPSRSRQKSCANQNIHSSESSGFDTTSAQFEGIQAPFKARRRSSSSSHVLIRLSSGCDFRPCREETQAEHVPLCSIPRSAKSSGSRYLSHAAGISGRITYCTLIRHRFAVRRKHFPGCFKAITNSVLRTLILARHFSPASVRECTPKCMGRLTGFRAVMCLVAVEGSCGAFPPLWAISVLPQI
jgi:hypothetical protein